MFGQGKKVVKYGPPKKGANPVTTRRNKFVKNIEAQIGALANGEEVKDKWVVKGNEGVLACLKYARQYIPLDDEGGTHAVFKNEKEIIGEYKKAIVDVESGVYDEVLTKLGSRMGKGAVKKKK